MSESRNKYLRKAIEITPELSTEAGEPITLRQLKKWFTINELTAWARKGRRWFHNQNKVID
jgi:hypothetical protein